MKTTDFLTELSNEKLAKYKTAAAADAKKADSEGDYKKGDKRFSGIVKATKKQFANDEKKIEEVGIPFRGVGGAFNRGDDERHDLDVTRQARPQVWGLKINGKVWNKGGVDVTFTNKQAAINSMNTILKNRPDLQGKIGLVTKGGTNEGSMGTAVSQPPGSTVSAGQRFYKPRHVPNQDEIQKQDELDEACWKGYHKEGNKKMFGKTYPNCVKNEGVAEGYDENYKFHMLAFLKDGSMKEFNVIANGDRNAKILAKKKLIEKGYTNIYRIDIQGMSPVRGPVNYAIDRNLRLEEQGVAEAEIQRKESYRGNTTPDVEYIVRDDNGNIVRHCKTKKEAKMWYDMITLNREEMWEKYPQLKVNEELTEEKCPHCNGPMFSEMIMNEKKDACYYKVKSRYSVWPSAYASGALVKCRKKGASNWGNGGKKNESSILEGINRADESLHDWFTKEKWVRMDTKGNIKGPCAREPGEGKPKCLPQSKAHSLGKKGRASAAQRKRREDPNPDRHGAAINVNTKKKSNESLDEGWKENLGAAALAGAMAFGGAGHAQAADLSGYNTQYLQQVAQGNHPRPMVSVDDAKAELQARANGKQQTVVAPSQAEAPKGFSKEYLQKAADPNRAGRYLISVEKAQELLKQMNEDLAEDQLDEKWSQKYKDSINCSNPKGFSQKAHCASKKK